MATTPENPYRRPLRRKIQSAPPLSRSSAIVPSSSFQKHHIFLYDWWLIVSESDSCAKLIAVGGFTSKQNQGIRSIRSAPVLLRQDSVTLKTFDGKTIMLHGFLNRSRTLENGFSHEVCDHFVTGFPYNWEKFTASLSVDANRTPTAGDSGSNMPIRNIFDDILNESHGDDFRSGASKATEESPRSKYMDSATNNGTPSNDKKNSSAVKRRRSERILESVLGRGTMTRSRTRVLKTRTWTRPRTGG